MITVYLAGPIAGMTDHEAGEWRRYVTDALKMYGFQTVDPFKQRDYRGRSGYDPAEVVEADKADINRCGVLLANCHAVSVETSQEILYAWERGKRVIIIHPDPPNASPWLRYHCEKMVTTPYLAIHWFTETKWRT